MRLNPKIALDRTIGKSLAILLNFIVWPVGKIVSIDHSDSPDKVKVIAIAKLVGMGSILRATPLVKALKLKYPSARYFLITTFKNKSLVENVTLFDEYFYIRDKSFVALFWDTILLIIKLWMRKIDLYFDLEVYSAFSTILATLSLARNRYGFYRESTRFRFGLNTHLVYFNEYKHITTIYLQLARACGIKMTDTEAKIEKIIFTEDDKVELEKWFGHINLYSCTDYIVINPNASDLLLERRWPLDYFAVLINAIALTWHNPIFLLGSPQEHPYNEALYNKLAAQAQKITFNSAGRISLKAAIGLISKTRLMITNDSGLYHVAISFGVPTISLWGPGVPEHYAEPGVTNNFVFYSRDVYCSPCLYKTDYPPCGDNNICMKIIHPKKVYIKSCEILRLGYLTDTTDMDYTYERICPKNLDITIRTLGKRQYS